MRSLALLVCLSLACGPFARSAAAAGQAMVRTGSTGVSISLPFQQLNPPLSARGSGALLSGGGVSLQGALPSVSLQRPTVERTPTTLGAPQAAAPAAPEALSPRAAELLSVQASINGEALALVGPDAASIPRIRRAPPGAAGLAPRRAKTPAARLDGRLRHVRAVGASYSASMDETEAKDAGDRLFDGKNAAGAATVRASSDGGLILRLARSPLGRLLPASMAVRLGRDPPPPGQAERREKVRALFRDGFGGPQELKRSPEQGRMSSLGRSLLYGLKWGINMTGIAAILSIVVRPIFAAVPWQLLAPEWLLEGFGRVLLLTGIGPHALLQALTASPFSFLFLGLPQLVLWEEVLYRLLGFGVPFILLALVKPAADGLANLLQGVPDVFGLRSAIQTLLRFSGRISSKAFPIAALYSALSFAMAHVAVWGIDPFSILMHAVLGLVLARVAYRSRSLVSSFTAHYSYNLIALTMGVLLPLHLLPVTAAVFGAMTTMLSLAFLWYNVRAYKKDRAAAVEEAVGRAPKARLFAWKRVLAAAMAVPLLFMALFGGVPSGMRPVRTAPDSSSMKGPQLQFPALAQPQVLTTEQLVQAAKPAVGQVIVKDEAGRTLGTGSGFIIHPSGLMVTNAHVVAKNAKTMRYSREYRENVVIRLANGMMVPAKVAAFNPDKDIALLQLPANPHGGWPVVALGDSSRLAEGEKVLAMGHPLGLPFTVTEGIVSGLNRTNPNSLNSFVFYIQHDAAVNPGNSGGLLLNQRGEVVGINTMIMSLGGGSDGIHLAITSNDLKAALDQYVRQGNIQTPAMGAVFHPGDRSAPDYGAYVELVQPDSPASQAGLRAGDVVTGLDGKRLPPGSMDAVKVLAAVIRRKAPGDSVKLTVERGGSTVELTVRLGGR